jgi:hypothetical protein
MKLLHHVGYIASISQHHTNFVSAIPPVLVQTARMEEFEAHLAAVTRKGANIVPGAIMGVVDSQG